MSGKWFTLSGKTFIYSRKMMHIFPENNSYLPGKWINSWKNNSYLPVKWFMHPWENESFPGKWIIHSRKWFISSRKYDPFLPGNIIHFFLEIWSIYSRPFNAARCTKMIYLCYVVDFTSAGTLFNFPRFWNTFFYCFYFYYFFYIFNTFSTKSV